MILSLQMSEWWGWKWSSVIQSVSFMLSFLWVFSIQKVRLEQLRMKLWSITVKKQYIVYFYCIFIISFYQNKLDISDKMYFWQDLSCLFMIFLPRSSNLFCLWNVSPNTGISWNVSVWNQRYYTWFGMPEYYTSISFCFMRMECLEILPWLQTYF